MLWNIIKYCSFRKPSSNYLIKILYWSFFPTGIGITKVCFNSILPEFIMMRKFFSIIKSNRFNSKFFSYSYNCLHNSCCCSIGEFNNISSSWNSIYKSKKYSLITFLWNNKVSFKMTNFFSIINTLRSLFYRYSKRNTNFFSIFLFFVSRILM